MHYYVACTHFQLIAHVSGAKFILQFPCGFQDHYFFYKLGTIRSGGQDELRCVC